MSLTCLKLSMKKFSKRGRYKISFTSQGLQARQQTAAIITARTYKLVIIYNS